MGTIIERAARGRVAPARSRTTAVLVALALALGACGGGDDLSSTDTVPAPAPSTSEPPATRDALQSCEAERHAVVIDLDGIVTISTAELGTLLAYPDYDPVMRDGAAALLEAWRDRGYEIVYLAGRPSDLLVGDTPLAEATLAWIEQHDLPSGDGTHLHLWDSERWAEMGHYKTQTLLDLKATGISIDFGYTDAEIDITAYRSGGLAVENIVTRGDAAGLHGTTTVTEESWADHVAEFVEPLEPVCELSDGG